MKTVESNERPRLTEKEPNENMLVLMRGLTLNSLSSSSFMILSQSAEERGFAAFQRCICPFTPQGARIVSYVCNIARIDDFGCILRVREQNLYKTFIHTSTREIERQIARTVNADAWSSFIVDDVEPRQLQSCRLISGLRTRTANPDRHNVWWIRFNTCKLMSCHCDDHERISRACGSVVYISFAGIAR